MTQHQPGSLKQSNKKHKSGSSKRAQKRSLGAGRVSSTETTKVANTNDYKSSNKDSRLNRRNNAQQLRTKKKNEAILQKRLGSNRGPPKNVTFIPLNHQVDAKSIVETLIHQNTNNNHNNNNSMDEIPSFISTMNTVKYQSIDKFNSNFAFTISELDDLLATLDIIRVADILVFVTHYTQNPQDFISNEVQLLFTTLKAMGCPDIVIGVQGINTFKLKSIPSALKDLQKYLENTVCMTIHVIDLDTPYVLQRQLSTMSLKEMNMRSHRSYLLADTIVIDENKDMNHIDNTTYIDESKEKCTIKLSGFLRGCPLYIHSLGHLPGIGTCKVQQIEVHKSTPFHTHHSSKSKDNDNKSNTTGNTVVYTVNQTIQESLHMLAQGDTIAGEQTWPTEEELNYHDNINFQQQQQDMTITNENNKNIPKNIPLGMSDYQADWYVDDDGHLDTSALDTYKKPSPFTTTATHKEGGDDVEDGDEDGDVDYNASVYHADNEDEEHMDDAFSMAGSMLDTPGSINPQALVYDKQLRKQANDDQEFPDEIDTPHDQSAKDRFARYRALQSFRSSPWHSKENLPQSYSYIYQFEDFHGIQRRTLNEKKAVESLQNQQVIHHIQHKKTVIQTKKKQQIQQKQKQKKSIKSNSDSMECDEDENENNEVEDDDDDDDMEAEDNDDDDNDDVHMMSHHHHEKEEKEEEGESEMDSYKVHGAEDYLQSGLYVTLTLTDVSLQAIKRKITSQQHVTWFNLHKYENKVSVLNFNIQRIDTSEDPIKSKQPLVFMAGFRTFEARPIFSEANLNCDKNKLERFLVHGRFSVATIFGPVCFQPCPVLIFQRQEDGSLKLVASGNLHNVDPDRIVLKKVILTGMPIRVNKKFAVVKHLFYNPQDVRWFKPAELMTKHGLRGKIREPVGTHGLLKVGFSAPIKQNDTVMLVLYKRVYPKFPIEGIHVV